MVCPLCGARVCSVRSVDRGLAAGSKCPKNNHMCVRHGGSGRRAAACCRAEAKDNPSSGSRRLPHAPAGQVDGRVRHRKRRALHAVRDAVLHRRQPLLRLPRGAAGRAEELPGGPASAHSQAYPRRRTTAYNEKVNRVNRGGGAGAEGQGRRGCELACATSSGGRSPYGAKWLLPLGATPAARRKMW